MQKVSSPPVAPPVAPPVQADVSATLQLLAPRRANAGRVTLASMLATTQVLVLLGIATLAVLYTDYGVLVSAVVIVALIADFVWFMTTGAGLMWRIAGIRLLAQTDDAPLGMGRLIPMPASWVVQARGYPDAVDPRLPPVVLTRSRQRGARTTASPNSLAQARTPGVPPMPATQAASPISEAPGAHQPTQPGAPATDQRESSQYHGGPVRVTIDGQSRVMFTGTAIVGRRPVAEGPGDSIITVTDLSRTLSKSHLRLVLESDGTLVVTDLGSTNGTAVVRSTGASEPLTPHTPVSITTSDQVELGDHELEFSTGSGA